MTVIPLETLHQLVDDAFQAWQVAWNDHGYNSPQERRAFERIKEDGLQLAEAQLTEEKELEKRALVRYLEEVRKGLDARLDPVEQDLELIRRTSGSVEEKLAELERRH